MYNPTIATISLKLFTRTFVFIIPVTTSNADDNSNTTLITYARPIQPKPISEIYTLSV